MSKLNILSISEETNIVFKAIRGYNPKLNSIFNLLSSNIYEGIVHKLNKDNINVSTQDIYDTFSECFDHYNAFVQQKEMALPVMSQEHYDMLVSIINDIVDEIEFMEMVKNEKEKSD